MGIGKKMTKGMIGGGVNIAHKSKMSNAAKNQMSFPGGMPGPGNYGSMDNKIVGKGMMKYLAGESVGMKKYGQHKGPEKALVGKQENLPEALKDKIEAAPGMYGKKKKGMKQMGEMEEAPMSGGPAKKSYKQAYKDRDQKTYGKMSEEEYTKEAKRQNASKKAGKGYDAPKKPIKKAEEKGDMDEVVVTAKKLTNRQAKTRKKAREATDTVQKEKLNKRQKRQEGRAERKKIRKAGLSRGEKRKQIIESRKKQNKSEGPAKTKKYVQDKEGKIEGKAKRIIGSGSGKVLASRNKKEVGKKYKK